MSLDIDIFALISSSMSRDVMLCKKKTTNPKKKKNPNESLNFDKTVFFCHFLFQEA